MKRVYLGIVATMIVLSGLAAAYLYWSQHSDTAPAAATVDAAAEPGAKESDKKEDKAPVSRIVQTVQIWPSDKPPVTTAQVDPVPAAGAAPEAAPAPAGEGDTAQAPPVQPSSALFAAAAPTNTAAQAPDQRNAARSEAPPLEHSSADTRTAQTALLASGGDHPSKAPSADGPPANEAGGTEPQTAPEPGQAVAADAEAAPSNDGASANPAKEHAPRATAAKAKPVQGEGGDRGAAAGKKAVHAEDRPFDATTSWWPAVTNSGGGLSLTYAGEAAFDKAIVLLFSKRVSSDAGSQIRLLDSRGKAVSGSWSVSPKNPQMLICKVPSGRYLVSIPAEFADAFGDKLGSSVQGPVYVH